MRMTFEYDYAAMSLPDSMVETPSDQTEQVFSKKPVIQEPFQVMNVRSS